MFRNLRVAIANNKAIVKEVRESMERFGTPTIISFETIENGKTTINDCELTIVYSPFNVLASKSSFAYCSKTVDKNGKEIFVICTDEYFNQLSEKEKQFVLCHELGHCISSQYTLKGERRLDYELNADQYAAGFVGRKAGINTLKKIYSFYSIGGKIRTRKEIKARINNLKQFGR